ncbi:uncharacterized protein PADG_11311 [Paracoccidioides brasiliensis Pb18]|uniref:Uncharacterized protein n=1 Tax=Paracoccidioides brasiliensis (strain Pb18) TaxID=502780 RepID=A0A0A0HTE4_PARBD|nr:uncharacterized protein PADG_11311 [Paracoccidioides brasiliensis Pb18]KGM92489.1 hypothetical protein PADG_11311 [Paracoccidioides brasiliensis Pb18]
MFTNLYSLKYDDTLLSFFELDSSKISLPRIVASSHESAFGSLAEGFLPWYQNHELSWRSICCIDWALCLFTGLNVRKCTKLPQSALQLRQATRWASSKTLQLSFRDGLRGMNRSNNMAFESEITESES